jgi:hypothetical protein
MSVNDAGLIDRWEYHVEYLQSDESHIRGRPDPTSRFNTLGAEGWELVSITTLEREERAGEWMCVFKRPLLQPPDEAAPEQPQRPHRFSSF